MALYSNMASFSDGQFNRCDQLWPIVIQYTKRVVRIDTKCVVMIAGSRLS